VSGYLGLKPVKKRGLLTVSIFVDDFPILWPPVREFFFSIATFDEQRVILQSFPNLTVSHLQKCFKEWKAQDFSVCIKP